MNTPTNITDHTVKAALEIVAAVAEAIKELGSVPSGHLYARLMGHMTLAQYDRVIDTLVSARLVKVTPSHEIIWIGGRS